MSSVLSKPMVRRVVGALAVGSVLSLVACKEQGSALPIPKYTATVTKTEFGIPHITADSWGSLGFGEAYTAAEDQLCNMALALVQARGESAAVFGPGPRNRNASRDIVVKALGISEKAQTALNQQAPNIRQWIEGYTAGFNQYVTEQQGNYGSWCDQADWVRPVTANEFMAQYVTLVHTLPRIAGAIVAAAPPAKTLSFQSPPPSEPDTRDIHIAALRSAPSLSNTLTDMKLRDMGSNAWAIAAERSENGKGILLANPHYPWYGIARFWEKHLTIPGVYNAYGAGLIGAPGVAVGFNEALGWSHTVSNSKRTVIYQLTLNPENPNQYRFENEWRDLTSAEVNSPTTLFTTIERRKELVGVALKDDVAIVEDDCFGSAQYFGVSYRALYPENGWYVASFSKSIAPSLRIGCAICHKGMADALRHIIFSASLGISSAQVYVANFVLRHSKLAEIQKMVRDELRVYVAETV